LESVSLVFRVQNVLVSNISQSEAFLSHSGFRTVTVRLYERVGMVMSLEY